MAVAIDLAPVVQNLRCNVELRSLRDAARVAAFVAPSRSATPAITNVKIETDEGDLILSATNLDADVRLRVRANVSQEGGCTLVDAKRFAGALSRAKGDATIEMLGTVLTVTTDAGRHALPTWPEADFPQLPEATTRPIATISGADLARMVRRIAYAMSADVTREHLCGALIERTDGVLRLVATDGHRMALASTPSAGVNFAVIVHRAAIDALARVDIEDEPEVMIRLSPSRVHFCAPLVEVSGKRVDAAFPSYQQILAQTSQPSGSITVDRKVFLGAMRAIGGRPRSGVRLDIDMAHQVVKLTTDDGEGHKASASVEATIGGDPPEAMGFAVQYLREPIEVLSDQHVRFQLGDALGPMKLEADDGTTALVMPMKI